MFLIQTIASSPLQSEISFGVSLIKKPFLPFFQSIILTKFQYLHVTNYSFTFNFLFTPSNYLTKLMNSIELIQKITARLSDTFAQISNMVQDQIKRINQMHAPQQKKDIQEDQNNKIQIAQAQKKTIEDPKQAHPKKVSKSENQDKTQKRRRSQQVEKNAPKADKSQIQKKKSIKASVEKPKKPLVASKIYLRQMQQNENFKEKKINESSIAKIAMKTWEEMEEDKKVPYLKMQKQLKQKYEEQMQKFYEENPQQKKKELDKKERTAQKKKQKQLLREDSQKKKKKKSTQSINEKTKPKKKSKVEQGEAPELKNETLKEEINIQNKSENVDQYLDLGNNSNRQISNGNHEQMDMDMFVGIQNDEDSLGVHL